MKPKIKQINFYTRFNRRKIIFPLFLLLLLAFAANGIYAQDAAVNIMTTSQCELEPGVYHMLTGVTLEIDGKAYELAGYNLRINLSAGAHKVRATVPGTDAKLLYVHAQGIKRQIYHADASGTVTVELDASGDNWEVRLESCISEETSLSRIKVLVTKSCTLDPAEEVTVARGAQVWVGKYTGMTDGSGTTQIQIKPGENLAVAATWKDAAIGFVKFNGMNTAVTETGLPAVNAREGTSTLEIRMVTCDPSGSRKARANVTVIGGEMYVKRFSHTTPVTFAVQPAFVGMTLRDGDEVSIMGGGQIQWIGGGTINFNNKEYTTIVIGPQAPEATQPRPVFLNLIKGTIRIFFPPGEPAKKNKFDASTGTVVVAVKGTEFILSYDEQTRISTVQVIEGEVEVTPINTAVPTFTLTAGRAVEVSGTTAKSIPFSPEGKTTTPPTTTTLPKNTPIRVCEQFPLISKTVCGTWTWNGSDAIFYQVDEGNQQPTLLMVERLNSSEIILTREDRTPSYGVYRARYTGRISGTRIEGEVSFTMGDLKGTNRWTAEWNSGGENVSNPQGEGFILEVDTDRPGADYKNFDLPQAKPVLCWEACQGDPNCKAFTYVKPGMQGASARCWLKSDVPAPVKNDCCESGLKNPKRVTDAVGTTGRPNLAFNRPTSQSSVYQPAPGNPQGAVDGVKNSGFGFHTNEEKNPWWQVDLGAVKNLSEIDIYNRLDCCSERARTIQVLLSNDGINFTRVFTNDGTIFGGADGKFLKVSLQGYSARYVRLQLNETNYLHLDEVEIY